MLFDILSLNGIYCQVVTVSCGIGSKFSSTLVCYVYFTCRRNVEIGWTFNRIQYGSQVPCRTVVGHLLVAFICFYHWVHRSPSEIVFNAAAGIVDGDTYFESLNSAAL